MQQFAPERSPFRRHVGRISSLSTAILILWITGCGGSSPSATVSPSQAGPQTYFAPFVMGTTNSGGILGGPEIYAVDDAVAKLSQSIFNILVPLQGPQVINAGTIAAGKRGLLNLGITANYVPDGVAGNSYAATVFNPPKPGGFVVELAGQAGGLVQLPGQPAVPLVAAVQCPSLTDAQTYQFITIPGGLIRPGAGLQGGGWNPATDTAYGSVDISSKGTAVSFKNIHQYTLPSVGGTGTPSQPASSSAAGICGPTVYGSTITVPGQLVITNPPGGEAPSIPPQATFGIGPSGLLVEDNGVVLNGTNAGQLQNTLGAGTGAVGLPKPSSALDANALRSAQYLGFVYGAGVLAQGSLSGWSSHLASFGFSSPPSSCAAVAANTDTLIYGGDFTKDDPSAAADGFGKCDLAIDLGPQDTTDNGLYTKATVWIGANYAANTTGATYSFQAIAVAGQLKGKFALFILGVDSTQPWAIYLLQSN